MSILGKLSYNTKLEMCELSEDVLDKVKSTFYYYDNSYIDIEDVLYDLNVIYNNCESSEKIVINNTINDIKRLPSTKSQRYTLDYTINTSINVSMVDFKNAGLTDEEILNVVRSKEYVNCAIMTRSFCGCEITFYSSCFNRNIIEQTVKEIQNDLNNLIKNK